MAGLGEFIRGAVGNQPGNVTLDAMKKIAESTEEELSAEQQTSRSNFLDAVKEAVNPFGSRIQQRSKEIKARYGTIQKMLKPGEKAKRLSPVELFKDTAQQFQQKNPELKSDILLELRALIKPDDTSEEIIEKIRRFYPDVSLADEVLEFLLETTEGELHRTVQLAKEAFNKQFGRQIAAGRNIAHAAREASERGLGTPTSMRDMYRDITGNPRDSVTLFHQLANQYAYKDLKKMIDFFFHALGEDMKAPGPSIARGLLHRLINETRSLQAILGVYRFFKSRMRLIHRLFTKYELVEPEELNFELLAKQFIALAGDRYPSGDKVLQLAKKLGIEDWLIAKIIVFSQLRDAVREVAVNQIYTTVQHRDEVYLSIIDALEALEEELEELEEKMSKDEDESEHEVDHEEREAG